MARVTIIGGHGKVALLAEPMLVDAGHQVTGIIRAESQSADLMARGATPEVVDIASLSVEQMTELFARLGTEVLIWSAGAGGVGGPERTYAIDRDAAIRSMDAAQAAGVKRYIMVSYLGAGADHGVPSDHGFYAYAEAKAAADEYLRSSGLDFTILGPGALTLEDEGGIEVTTAPAHNGDSSDTSRATVARVLTATVADDSTIGKAAMVPPPWLRRSPPHRREPRYASKNPHPARATLLTRQVRRMSSPHDEHPQGGTRGFL